MHILAFPLYSVDTSLTYITLEATPEVDTLSLPKEDDILSTLINMQFPFGSMIRSGVQVCSLMILYFHTDI